MAASEKRDQHALDDRVLSNDRASHLRSNVIDEWRAPSDMRCVILCGDRHGWIHLFCRLRVVVRLRRGRAFVSHELVA
jgi:uncharacterized protein YjhX (UPF0386 family)